MDARLKTNFLAFAVMSGVGVSAPAAAYVVQHPAITSQRFANAQLGTATWMWADGAPERELQAPAVTHLGAPLPPVDEELPELIDPPDFFVSATPAEPPPLPSEEQRAWRAAKSLAAASGSTKPAPLLRCREHQSETLAGGVIRVCDADRTDNGKRGLFHHQARALAPRTLPSPTGIIRPPR